MGTWTATPRTWVAGEVPTATHFNENVRDLGRAFADAWTAYTPTIGGFSLGSGGTTTAKYTRRGKTATFKVLTKMGPQPHHGRQPCRSPRQRRGSGTR